jgi:hypothetical protein
MSNEIPQHSHVNDKQPSNRTSCLTGFCLLSGALYVVACCLISTFPYWIYWIAAVLDGLS